MVKIDTAHKKLTHTGTDTNATTLGMVSLCLYTQNAASVDEAAFTSRYYRIRSDA
jgi:hypothetical protein